MSFRSGRSAFALHFVKLAVLITLAISSFSIVESQTFRGGINGSVTDQSGAVIPGAQVQVTNDDTDASRTAESSSGGEYSFQDLPIGSYTIKVVASGFQNLKVSKVPVSAGTIYSLPLKLSIAQTA